MFMFPAYAAAPAGLQVDTQMEEKNSPALIQRLSIYFSAVLTSGNKALMWNVWVFDIPSAMGVFLRT